MSLRGRALGLPFLRHMVRFLVLNVTDLTVVKEIMFTPVTEKGVVHWNLNFKPFTTFLQYFLALHFRNRTVVDGVF